MPATRYPLLATLLRRYFYSGWAFLIPYLAAYLLYYLTSWPVNPPTDAGSMAHRPSPFAPPPLIHFYGFLHALHLSLAGAALWSWFQDRRAAARLSAASLYPLPATHYSLLTALAPWAILALLFYIPGVYLEWPSDPWEHLRRINEWRILDTVGAHSSWHKSSYFIPYSFLNWCIGLRQLFWLDFYYTGICLLLCWQYYRLARACGLGKRASMIFVIMQALLFGNNIFSFYRYYGISSSIYAQLAAIALTRIVLEWTARGTSLDRFPSITRYPLPSTHGSARAYSLLTTHYSLLRYPSRPTFWHLPSLLRLLAVGLCLLVLIAFNHAQGLGIAVLGILAVTIWRIIEWKRSVAGYLVLATILSSIIMVMCFPRHPAIDEIYRAQGWLNPWYGFNLFFYGSPAFDRAAQILGAFGALNIALSLWLVVREKHIAGWLTLLPTLILALPCFALPLSHVISSQTHPDNIIIFHRFLFATPMGLALVTLGVHKPKADRKIAGHKTSREWAKGLYPLPANRHLLICAGLASATLLSPSAPAYNHFWQSIQCVPADLQLLHLVAPWTPVTVAQAQDENTLMTETVLGSQVYRCFAPSRYPNAFRQIHDPLDAAELERRIASLNFRDLSKDVGLASHGASVMKLAGELILTAPNRGSLKPITVVDLRLKDASWTTLSGSHHQQVFSNGSLMVSNSPGAATNVFSSQMIPVSRDKRYQLSCTVRQIQGSPTVNYLAVIWYDQEKRFLASALPRPEGAGTPAGWSNGTYSYYGLAGQPAPAEWTQYVIAFGLGTHAAIPTNAAFIRIGALLNYRATPDAQVQLTEAQLQSIPIQRHLIWLPTGQPLYTSTSFSASLSGHWPLQRMALDHAGINEMKTQLLAQPTPSLPLSFPAN